MNSTFYLFDPEEYYSRELEPLGEMATITRDEELSIRIQVNPDRGRIGVPYFKVFNTPMLLRNKTKVARLHFMDSGMEYHQDEFMDWVISNQDIKNIKKVLNKKYKDTQYTIWQMTCYQWNFEYASFYNGKDIRNEDEYFNGVYDADPDFYNHPSYIPSITVIPETWVYNPPKKKNKRK